MLTVKFTDYSSGCISVDGYPLHEIDVVYGLSTGGACGTDQNQIQAVGTVWVDNRAATIDDAYAAGYTIYDGSDCTVCAVLALTQARYTYGILKTLAYGKVLYHVAVDK